MISIIIPAYNAVGLIDPTLRSVRAQTFADWECVIVDDGSSDGTYEHCRQVVRDDPRFKVVRQANGGVANARNRGYAESASGSEAVIFLDHDDCWVESCLETLLAALRRWPDAAAAHGLALACDKPNESANSVEPHVKNRVRKLPVDGKLEIADAYQPTTYRMLLWDNVITTTGAALFRRGALSEMPYVFDQSFAPLDDWDLYFRLAFKRDLAYVDEVVIHWRQHSANTSKNRGLMNAATCKIRRRMLGETVALTSEERALIQRRFRRMVRSDFRQSAAEHAKLAGKELRSGRVLTALREYFKTISDYSRYCLLQVHWSDKLSSQALPDSDQKSS